MANVFGIEGSCFFGQQSFRFSVISPLLIHQTFDSNI